MDLARTPRWSWKSERTRLARSNLELTMSWMWLARIGRLRWLLRKSFTNMDYHYTSPPARPIMRESDEAIGFFSGVPSPLRPNSWLAAWVPGHGTENDDYPKARLCQLADAGAAGEHPKYRSGCAGHIERTGLSFTRRSDWLDPSPPILPVLPREVS